MHGAVLTKELAIKAILHGACGVPDIGTPISSLSTHQLIWAEDRGIIPPELTEALGLPGWLLSGSGYGYGSGYGDGYGDGYGSG